MLGLRLFQFQEGSFGKSLNSMSKKGLPFIITLPIFNSFSLRYQINQKLIPNTFLEVRCSDLPLQIEGYFLLQCVTSKRRQYMDCSDCSNPSSNPRIKAASSSSSFDTFDSLRSKVENKLSLVQPSCALVFCSENGRHQVD